MSHVPSPREQIERLLAIVRRALVFWKRGFLVFVVGALIAFPYVLTRPRDYKSETVILYHETIHSSDLTGVEGGEGARRVGARLRELLLARASLEPIINDLKLYQDKIIHGEAIGAIEEMRKHITFRARDGDTFEISFVGSTPEEAQEVTRRLGECIIKEADSRRADSAKTLKEFLHDESARNQAALREKEGELGRFVALHPEFTPRLQGIAPAAIPSSAANLHPSSAGDPVLLSLEIRAARIDRQLRAAAGQPPPPAPKPLAPFQPPPDSTELVAARQDFNDKSNRFTTRHPDVIAAKNRLKAAEDAQALATAAARDAWEAKRAAQPTDDPPPPKNATDEAALRAELENIQHHIANRRAELLKAKPSADGGPAASAPIIGNTSVELELEFTRLQREVNEFRDRQQKLDERLFRAGTNLGSVMNDRNVQVSVLDAAFLPIRPSSKPRTTLLAGLLAAALIIALATMVVSAMLDDRIYERIDVDKLDLMPVLVVVPRVRSLPGKTEDSG